MRKSFWYVLMAAIALVAVWLHFFRIDSLPRGFYVDESSIGYNARLIATEGIDEHGVRWPLFFEAFGEYKNPLYIYLTALDYKLFGYSPWTTRATSALCWLLGTLFLMLLGRRLFGDVRTQLYLLLCASFTPWLFSLSRISFEVIVLYPLLALHLWAVYRAYEEGSKAWAAVAGVSIGLALYGYSSFRLLAPLHVAVVLICYPNRRYWRTHVPFVTAAAVAALPYAVYLRANLAALTLRFNYLTYLHDGSLSKLARIQMFLSRYFDYLGPQFLMRSGDPNPRHHSGYGGEMLLVTALLLILGIVKILATGELRQRPFLRFLLAGLLLSPVAAAMTTELNHSLRAFSLVVFLILLSAVGMNALFERSGKLPVSIATIALAAVAINAGLYVRDYFTRYPAVSVAAFENFGFKEALENAVAATTGKVVVSTNSHRAYVQLAFFEPCVPNPRGMAVKLGEGSEIEVGDVFVEFDPEGKLADSRANLPEGSLFGWRLGEPPHRPRGHRRRRGQGPAIMGPR